MAPSPGPAVGKPGPQVQQRVVGGRAVPVTSVTAGNLAAGASAAAAPPTVVPVPSGPPFQITAAHERARYLKLLVYGEYGVGKTRLAGSAALIEPLRDVLMVDCEAGDLTISTVDDAAYIEGTEHTDVVRVSSFKQLSRVQEYLKYHCRVRDSGDPDTEEKLKDLEKKLRSDFDPQKPARRYNTVLVDSLSEAESFSMYQLLGISDTTRLDEEVATPEFAEYKRNYSQILRMVRAFRDLPMHVIMTCAATDVQDEHKRMIWRPALTGRLSKQVQGFMDMVGFLVVTQTEGAGPDQLTRRMFVQPSTKFNAKNRLAHFKGAYFDNPTVHSIVHAVNLLPSLKG